MVLHPVDQIGLLLRLHDPHTIDPGRLAASIDLRDPPHRNECVAARTEHQLLQVADPLQVPFPRRREDPLP